MRRTRNLRRKWLIGIGTVIAAGIIISVSLVLPLRWLDPATTAFMLQDESGIEPLRFEWRELENISEYAMLAVVAAEDQRFADHHGIDFEAIRDSIDAAQRGQGLRGASTLTQQVAKNLYLWPGRNFLRKGLEAWFALLIEVCWPKRRILEVYLNIAEFGPGTYGVAAASRHYFGKSAAYLYVEEAALLAAVLPNPRRFDVRHPSDYLRERQRWIIGQIWRLQREQWLRRLE